MKKSFLLTAAGVMAVGAAVSGQNAQALPKMASMQELQNYLVAHPDSAQAGEVFGQLIQKVAHESRGFERSGNPKAAGGPANPGRGRGVNGHY